MSKTSPKRVEVLAEEAAFTGFLRVNRYRLRYERFTGGMGAPVVREVMDRGGVVAVLPVDPVNDQVVLVEQFRPGAHVAGLSPWLLECVAGLMEPGESGQDVAVREALEEAGCRLYQLLPIGRYLSSPGASSEVVELFVGRTAGSVGDGPVHGALHGLAEEGEDIRVHLVRVDEAVEWLDQGAIVNAKTIIVLQWLARHYTDLKRRWLADESR